MFWDRASINPLPSSIIYVNGQQVGVAETTFKMKDNIVHHCIEAFGYSGIDGMGKETEVKFVSKDTKLSSKCGIHAYTKKDDTNYDLSEECEAILVVVGYLKN